MLSRGKLMVKKALDAIHKNTPETPKRGTSRGVTQQQFVRNFNLSDSGRALQKYYYVSENTPENPKPGTSRGVTQQQLVENFTLNDSDDQDYSAGSSDEYLPENGEYDSNFSDTSFEKTEEALDINPTNLTEKRNDVSTITLKIIRAILPEPTIAFQDRKLIYVFPGCYLGIKWLPQLMLTNTQLQREAPSQINFQ
ncbi:hypothetical protein FQR65_LT14955 [Abscondita terminalis]|nr:hypothetical protein FQR65_LT14955 [Abscondita terminalis]